MFLWVHLGELSRTKSLHCKIIAHALHWRKISVQCSAKSLHCTLHPPVWKRLLAKFRKQFQNEDTAQQLIRALLDSVVESFIPKDQLPVPSRRWKIGISVPNNWQEAFGLLLQQTKCCFHSRYNVICAYIKKPCIRFPCCLQGVVPCNKDPFQPDWTHLAGFSLAGSARLANVCWLYIIRIPHITSHKNEFLRHALHLITPCHIFSSTSVDQSFRTSPAEVTAGSVHSRIFGYVKNGADIDGQPWVPYLSSIQHLPSKFHIYQSWSLI